MHDWHSGWMSIWWVLLIAVVGLVVWAAMSLGSRRRDEPPELTVKRRYARGEIDQTTYERLMHDLRTGGSRGPRSEGGD